MVKGEGKRNMLIDHFSTETVIKRIVTLALRVKVTIRFGNAKILKVNPVTKSGRLRNRLGYVTDVLEKIILVARVQEVDSVTLMDVEKITIVFYIEKEMRECPTT